MKKIAMTMGMALGAALLGGCDVDPAESSSAALGSEPAEADLANPVKCVAFPSRRRQSADVLIRP